MSENLRIDPIDLEILRLLQNDARMTNRDLATSVGIAPSTCLDRVARLRSAGVIQGQALRVAPEAMGRPIQAFVSIQVQPHRRPLVEPLVEHIRAQPESRAVYHLTGPDDFLVLVAAASVADLQRLVLDELTVRPEVTRVQTMLIFEEWDAGPLLPPGT